MKLPPVSFVNPARSLFVTIDVTLEMSLPCPRRRPLVDEALDR
jgi:hypothetical protein